MPKNRPSLSSPTYGALTGTINWSRGMGESLATPSSAIFTPPVQPASSTTPSSSTPASGGCVAVAAWVIRRGWWGRQQRVCAGDVRVGDRLLLEDGRWGRVTYSTTKAADCVRVELHDGTLTCSLTAPLHDADGSMVLAPATEARTLRALNARQFTTRVVQAVSRVGAGMIQHITCENDYFWAGDAPELMLAHHNMKPPAGLKPITDSVYTGT